MKLSSLLSYGLIVAVVLILALWAYGTYAPSPFWVDMSMYLGDGLVMLGAYLVPSATALLVDSPRKRRIILINILGGWLIIPWIIAMLMSLKSVREAHPS